MSEPPITPAQALDYEIRGSWWATIPGPFYLGSIARRYFGWKARFKHAIYRRSRVRRERLEEVLVLMEAEGWGGKTDD